MAMNAETSGVCVALALLMARVSMVMADGRCGRHVLFADHGVERRADRENDQEAGGQGRCISP